MILEQAGNVALGKYAQWLATFGDDQVVSVELDHAGDGFVQLRLGWQIRNFRFHDAVK